MQTQKAYSSTVSLTSALDGVDGQFHNPDALPSEKRKCTHFYSRLSGPQGLSWEVRKISPLPVFDPWIRQPITKLYAGVLPKSGQKFYFVSVWLLLYIAGGDPSNLQVCHIEWRLTPVALGFFASRQLRNDIHLMVKLNFIFVSLLANCTNINAI
jgi:hypothetical protein